MVYFDPSTGNYFKLVQCDAPPTTPPQQPQLQPQSQSQSQQPQQSQWQQPLSQQPWQQQPLSQHQLLQQWQPQPQQVRAAAVTSTKSDHAECSLPEHLRTTVMVRNIPNQYSREQLER